MNINLQGKTFLGMDLVALLRLIRPATVLLTAAIPPLSVLWVVVATVVGGRELGDALAVNVGTLLNGIPAEVYLLIGTIAAGYFGAKTTEAVMGRSPEHGGGGQSFQELLEFNQSEQMKLREELEMFKATASEAARPRAEPSDFKDGERGGVLNTYNFGENGADAFFSKEEGRAFAAFDNDDGLFDHAQDDEPESGQRPGDEYFNTGVMELSDEE